MKRMSKLGDHILFLILIAFTGSVMAAPSSVVSPEIQVDRVITEMNKAVTDQDVDRILATFSDDAIRFDLFHVKDSQKKGPFAKTQTSDLATMWSSIAKIMFPATKFYERKVAGMTINVDRSMATVWTKIETRSQSKEEGSKVQENSFTEVYLLKLTKGIWKISAITNNRKDNYVANKGAK